MRFVFGHRRQALLCVLLLLLAVSITYPFADVASNDDFAYIFSAKRLAETGHIVYCGWSSAMLGWQLFLGALFIKLFGFSFFVVRMPVLLLGLATAFLLQRTNVRLGLSERSSTFATLVVVLSPVFIPLSLSFMTDVPALFGIMVAIYACIRGVQSRDAASATNWLLFATASGALLGTARQTVWLGMLAVVPSAALICHPKLLLRRLVPIWLISVAFMVACMRWFSHQLYTTHESGPSINLAKGHLIEVAVANTQLALYLALLLLPVLVAFVFGRFSAATRAVLALVVVLVASVLFLRPHSYATEVLLMPTDTVGNYFTANGTLQVPSLGQRPLQLSPFIRTSLTIFACFISAAFIASIFKRTTAPSQILTPHTPLPWRDILFLLGPFAALSFCFLLLRTVHGIFFDRYLLPVLPIFVYATIRIYHERFSPVLPLRSWAAMSLVAIYGVATTHDFFVTERARLAAISQIEMAGVPRNELYGTFGYNGWTQVQQAGYMNTGGITLPPSAPPFAKPRFRSLPCGRDMSLFSVVHARFAISYDDKTCGSSGFSPVSYKLWLAPRKANIYIRTVQVPTSQVPGDR